MHEAKTNENSFYGYNELRIQREEKSLQKINKQQMRIVVYEYLRRDWSHK